MTGTLIERLWESDEASRLTNEAARVVTAMVYALKTAEAQLVTLGGDVQDEHGDTIQAAVLSVVRDAIRKAEGNE